MQCCGFFFVSCQASLAQKSGLHSVLLEALLILYTALICSCDLFVVLQQQSRCWPFTPFLLLSPHTQTPSSFLPPIGVCSKQKEIGLLCFVLSVLHPINRFSSNALLGLFACVHWVVSPFPSLFPCCFLVVSLFPCFLVSLFPCFLVSLFPCFLVDSLFPCFFFLPSPCTHTHTHTHTLSLSLPPSLPLSLSFL